MPLTPSPESQSSDALEPQHSSTLQQVSKRKLTVSGVAAGILAGLGLAFAAVAYALATETPKEHNAEFAAIIAAMAMFLGSSSWWISGRNDDVGKIIRSELIASTAGFFFSGMMANHVTGSLHQSLVNGGIGLCTGAIAISSFRAFIEAINARIESRRKLE